MKSIEQKHKPHLNFFHLPKFLTSKKFSVAEANLESDILVNFKNKNFAAANQIFCQEQNSREFLNSIIHELKNPLNVIIGFSQILRDEANYKVSPQERADYLKDINESANDLNNLIHDLLDVGSALSGNFSVDLSAEIDVKDLIKRSIKLNYDYALSGRIKLVGEVAEDLNFIKLDAKRMKQILANLISNSIKYSPEKTEIKISAQNILENGAKYLQIIVADQGFGMTPDQVQLAFQKYQTIKNPNSGKVDSFGLGLPIVKQLVELQNGTIEIKSELNKGTEIKLKFPQM